MDYSDVTKKENSVLGGVSCSAKHCEYNTETGYCRASKINVGTTDAKKSNETNCSTFKNKNIF